MIGKALKRRTIQTELVMRVKHPGRAGHQMSFAARSPQPLQQAHPINGTGCA
jgi:hypothetical protein